MIILLDTIYPIRLKGGVVVFRKTCFPHRAAAAKAPRRLLALLLALICAAALAPSAFAEDGAKEAEEAKRLRLTVSGAYSAVQSRFLAEGADPLTDGTFRTEARVYGALALSAPAKIGGLYIVFADTPTELTISAGQQRIRFIPEYLEVWIDVSALGAETLSLAFTGQVNVCDIYAFTEGEPPAWVQRWAPPCEKADLLLVSAHADDEQLYFAGVLPYYAGELGYAVQVAYFTDHLAEPHRRHELLKGLWTVGVRNYPVIGAVPDAYSESEAAALKKLAAAGMTRDDAVLQQLRLLRRFKPQVVVTHDLEGEYGHGQHRLCASTMLEAAALAADPESDPSGASIYGAWDVPKLYLHLYAENPVTLNWDFPLDAFGGKTAFQVSQQGFLCHLSQTNSRFDDWIFGEKRDITKASEIAEYSPCLYGLARSAVGADMNKNDFFENIITYAEQERLAAEAEAKRAEEERAEADKKAPDAEADDAAKEASRLRGLHALAVAAACLLALSVAAYFARRAVDRKKGK